MTREELFKAIGGVEEERLARSELRLQEPSVTSEGTNMDRKKINGRRIFRNLLVAAAIISMLGVTAYAVAGWVMFDSPEEMVAAVFGDSTGYDHKPVTTWTDPEKPGSVYENPAYDRVPADETVVAQDVAPHVSPVGRVLKRDGYTLTVDAYMFDSTTGSGIVTYTLEAENGLPAYELQPDGELWFPGMPDPVDFNQYGKTFIIQEKTTEDKLAVTFYFHYDEAYNKEFSVALGDYTEMTSEEIGELTIQCAQEVREKYTPEEAVALAKESLGDAMFQAYCGLRDSEDAAYAEIASELYMEKLAALENRWNMAEEEIEILFGQCEEEARKRYAKDEVIPRAEEYCAYRYLSNELYFEKADTREKIIFDCSQSSKLDCVTMGEGSVIVTPISFQLDVDKLEFLHETIENGKTYIDGGNVDSVVIRYQDGTEYIVTSEDVRNVVFALSSAPKDSETGDHSRLNYMFNRIVDVDKVTSVVVNGVGLAVD